MQAKANGNQTLWVLLIALVLIVLCIGGLWAYVQSADAEPGVTEAGKVELLQDSAALATREKYDNHPSNISGDDLELFFQGFGLTLEEKGRLTTLQADFAAGKRPAGKAPSLPAETGFAIVMLDPESFAGETAYYFLPGERLTDEQLLLLIAYGEEKGMPFTADTLSVKNCMRGGAAGFNRFFSAGENARRVALYKRAMEEGLRPETQGTTEISQPISGRTEIPLNPDFNSGLDSFQFTPIRAMTDAEILDELFFNATDSYINPMADASLNPFADTAKARALLEDVLGMPMAAARDVFSYSLENETGAKLFQVTFKTPKINGMETIYNILMEVQSGQCRSLSFTTMDDRLYYTSESGGRYYGPNGEPDPADTADLNDPRYAQSAQAAVEKLTRVKMEKVEPMARVCIIGTYDMGVLLAVQMADGTAYQVTVRFSDAVVAGVDYGPGGLDVAQWLKIHTKPAEDGRPCLPYAFIL